MAGGGAAEEFGGVAVEEVEDPLVAPAAGVIVVAPAAGVIVVASSLPVGWSGGTFPPRPAIENRTALSLLLCLLSGGGLRLASLPPSYRSIKDSMRTFDRSTDDESSEGGTVGLDRGGTSAEEGGEERAMRSVPVNELRSTKY